MIGLNAQCETAREWRRARDASSRVRYVAVVCARREHRAVRERREWSKTTALCHANHNILCRGKRSVGIPFRNLGGSNGNFELTGIEPSFFPKGGTPPP